MKKLKILPVTRDRWKDLIDLFERKGPRGGTPPTNWCWCCFWRERTFDRKINRAAMAKNIREGQVPGLLAYESGRPVGWISVAPLIDHNQLLRSPSLKPKNADEEGVYSIVCFYVQIDSRRRGIAEALLSAGVEYVRSRGGKVVEAYPSENPTGYSSQDFMGTKSQFLRCGFKPVRKARSRTIMRRVIDDST